MQKKQNKVDDSGRLRIERIPHNDFKAFDEIVSSLLKGIQDIADTKPKNRTQDFDIFEHLSETISLFEEKLKQCEGYLKEDIDKLKSEIEQMDIDMKALNAQKLSRRKMDKKLSRMKLKNMEIYLDIVTEHKKNIPTLKFESMEKMQLIRTSQ